MTTHKPADIFLISRPAAAPEPRTCSLGYLNPEMTFNEAFEKWISLRVISARDGAFSRARYISPRTEWDYRQYARTLAKMFHSTRLRDIEFSKLRAYQEGRGYGEAPWSTPTGPNRIRKEVGLLIRIMQVASAWTDGHERFFEPLKQEESEIQRALSPEEQERFLDAAAGNEKYRLIYYYTLAALQTSCSTNELRAMRLGDIDLINRLITIRAEGAKNKFRMRSIPLVSDEVVWAFGKLAERATKMGASDPLHYLFPFRRSGNDYDPTRPMGVTAIYKSWEAVRTIADVPWLRPYDLRHTSITRMAEAAVPISTIMSMAGHVSIKMQQHYTTISSAAKQQSLAATWVRPTKQEPGGGRTTQHTAAPQQLEMEVARSIPAQFLRSKNIINFPSRTA